MDPPDQYEYCGFEVIEAQLKKHIEAKRNIAYIEKDSRVNYLDNVLEIAADSGYLCVFRNLDPTQSDIQVIGSSFL